MADQTAYLRILVPLDGSDLATVSLPFVRAIATETTEVVLLRVVPDEAPLLGIPDGMNERVEKILSRNEAAENEVLNQHFDAIDQNRDKRLQLGEILRAIAAVADHNAS